MRERVEVRVRKLLGAPYQVHAIYVDGRLLREQIGPFDAGTLRAAGAPTSAARQDSAPPRDAR